MFALKRTVLQNIHLVGWCQHQEQRGLLTPICCQHQEQRGLLPPICYQWFSKSS